VPSRALAALVVLALLPPRVGRSTTPSSPPPTPARGDTIPPDSTYSTPALRTVVAAAAARNRDVPRRLGGYQARVESELAVVNRQQNGTEGAVEIEEVASDVRWRRTGALEQHIIGYRARLAALSPSLLGFVDQSWLVPVLYGNRLSLFFGADTTAAGRQRATRDSAIHIVHPLSRDRDAIYRFSGGDTVLTLHTPSGRRIPVVRVRVVPRADLRTRTVIFRGDLYLDADRHQLVRMRGEFAQVGGHRSVLERLQGAVIQTLFVVDLTNAEVGGAYWLPVDQRIEGQIASPFGGEGRTILRVQSHFSQFALEDTAGAVVALADSAARDSVAHDTLGLDAGARDSLARGDTLRALPHGLSYAPSDSVTHYHDWTRPLGDATASVRSDSYDDLAPDFWRRTGPPRIDPRVDRFGDFLHVDRVEGLYTGFGAALRLRDVAPGVVIRGNAGYAWTERTARGALDVDWTPADASARIGIRAERSLANTNDFRTAGAAGPTIEALVAQDNFDYVDRRRAFVYGEKTIGVDRAALVQFDAGVGEDKGEARRLLRPVIFPWVFVGDSVFRPNRGVLPGGYARVTGTLVLHPAVDEGFATPGIGVRLHDTWAGGDLSWNRAEASVIVREPAGPFTLLGRLDGGIVTGTVIPPQQLFELGFGEGLLAYDYKEFAGDQAGVLQAEIQYQLPIAFLSRPLRLPGGLLLPGPTPALAAGVQNGWAEIATAAGRLAVAELGNRVDPGSDRPILIDGHTVPVSGPTDGIRTSINILLRMFGGALGVGIARAVGDADGADHRHAWTSFVALGASF
jgi:hypothetical protein